MFETMESESKTKVTLNNNEQDDEQDSLFPFFFFFSSFLSLSIISYKTLNIDSV